MDEKQWAEARAKEVKEKRQREQLETQKRLLDDKQRVAEAPGLWQAFVTRVQERVRAFNDALGEEALQIRTKPNEIAVGAHNFVSQITADLRTERLELRCMLVSTSADYPVAVLGGKVTFVSGRGSVSGGRAITPDEIAENFLGSLIKIL